MPNIKSAKKRVLVTKDRTARNKNDKTILKTVLKKTNAAIEAGENVVESVKVAQSAVDKTSAKGLIHKNKAARLKSQLAKKAHA